MSNFFERLAGVIHWIGFLITCYALYLFISDPGLQSDPIWFSVIVALIPNTIGWLIKYIFTGDGKFFPF